MAIERIVRILLPVPLIKQMDELVTRGAGGFQTRSEFVREAVESQVMELTYEPADAVAAARAEEIHFVAVGSVPQGWNLAQSELHIGAEPVVLADGLAVADPGPLFGLHNRDYPSLWCAHVIAELTVVGVVSFADATKEITRRAWPFAAAIDDSGGPAGLKRAALFPTNPDKKEAAEAAFLSFALGSVARGSGLVRATGPLFTWGICQVTGDKELSIGLTVRGLALLKELEGLSLDLPHSRAHATSFLAFLRTNAPEDHAGFLTAIKAAAEGAMREDLIHAFNRANRDWTGTVAATNAAGYVARAREWGLIEPKQRQGHYALTAFGAEYVKEVESAA